MDVGDVNGDGVEDVLVATWYAENTYGGGYLVYGPLSGHQDLDSAGIRLRGTINTYGAGRSIGLGDTNSDGYDDMVFGSPYYGSSSAWLVLGPVNAGANIEDVSYQLKADDNAFCGHGTDLGDVNADGYGDAIVGSENGAAACCAGAAYVVHGPTTGESDLGAADVVVRGGTLGQFLGSGVAARDVDGNGSGDLLIGAAGDDTVASDAGAAFLFYGPLSGSYVTTDAASSFWGESGGGAGQGVAIGDVDGDGWGDMIIGAPSDGTGGRGSGAFYVQYPAF